MHFCPEFSLVAFEGTFGKKTQWEGAHKYFIGLEKFLCHHRQLQQSSLLHKDVLYQYMHGETTHDIETTEHDQWSL